VIGGDRKNALRVEDVPAPDQIYLASIVRFTDAFVGAIEPDDQIDPLYQAASNCSAVTPWRTAMWCS
jgi:hypothetical protein